MPDYDVDPVTGASVRPSTPYSSPDGRQIRVVSTQGILFSDDFGGAAIDSSKWTLLDAGYNPISGGAATPIGAGAAVVSGSNLAVTMPATATAEWWLLSNVAFTGSEDIFLTLSRSVSSVNNSCFVGLVEVDPVTLLPLLNANLANDFTNRGGFEFGKTAGASTYGVEAVADSSGAIASGTAGTSAATMATLQEFMCELEAVDIIGSSQLIDTIAGRSSAPARVATQCPNDGKVYKLLIRIKNTGATACVWTFGRVLVKDGQEFRAEISGGRGDTIGQKAIAVNIAATGASSGNVQGPNASNVAASNPVQEGILAASTQPTVATAGRVVSAQGDTAGRQVVKLNGLSTGQDYGRIVFAATTETSLIAAAGAGIRTELQTLTFANLDTVKHIVDIRDDSTGGLTVRLTIVCPPGDTKHLEFPAGLSQTTANKAWSAQLRETLTTTWPELTAASLRTVAT